MSGHSPFLLSRGANELTRPVRPSVEEARRERKLATPALAKLPRREWALKRKRKPDGLQTKL
jgi:hypothetical protein